MASLMLCRSEPSTEYYEIEHIHRKITTIEELCLYIRLNLPLIDEKLFKDNLFGFLKSLGLEKLSEDLKYHTEKKSSLSIRVAMLLKGGRLFSNPEIMRIENEIEKFKTLSVLDRKLRMAKKVLEFGEAREAILISKTIEESPDFEKESEVFKGEVAKILGASYGLMFYYEESLRMYEIAYEYLKDEKVLVPFLYAARRFYDDEAYEALVSSKEEYKAADKIRIKEEAEVLLDIPNGKNVLNEKEVLESYRRQ